MKYLLLVLLTALSVTANAQLFVGPTATDASFIYVNDTYIYVDKDVELETNSVSGLTNVNIPSILLRNQAQLLQGTATGSDELNKGSGIISLFQEGTTNQYDYNLWASPVGLPFESTGATAADGNGLFAFRPSVVAGGVSIPQQVFYVPIGANAETTSNPAQIGFGLNGQSANNLLRIASFWIYGYEAGNSTADFIAVQDTGTLPAGLGFTMKGVSGTDLTAAADGVANNLGVSGDGLGQRIDFRGRPNSGTITATVLPDTQTITGNPYPSALDLNYFLLLNSDSGPISATLPSGEMVSFTGSDVTDGMAYFWESDPTAQTHFIEEYQAGYGVYSPMGLLASDGMYVAAQYFMYDEDGNQIGGPVGNGDGTLERRFSPMGQGFMVVGSDTQAPGNDTFTFTNDMRIFVKEGNNSDFRNNEEDEVVEAVGVGSYYEDITNFASFSQFKIGVNINDTYGRELGVGILDHATRGYDTAMDGKGAGTQENDVTFSINEKDEYVINAVPNDEYQALTLSIKAATTSEFRFRAREIKDFTYDGIYLFDTVTEIYHDIQNESTLILLPAGEYPKRFEIRFTREIEEDTTDEEEEEETEEEEEETTEEETEWEEETTWQEEEDTLSVTIPESILESYNIFQNNSAGQLEIRNPNGIAITNVMLYDMTGKEVLASQDLGNKDIYTFSTRSLSSGVYVVSFMTEVGLTKSRKISITNR